MTLGDLILKIAPDSGWSDLRDNIKATGGELARFGSDVTKMGGFITAGISGPAIAGGAALLKFGTDFESARNIIIAGTGAIGAELTDLEGSFQTAFGRGDESAEEVATTIAKLNTVLGLTGAPLEDLTSQVADLADVTGEELAPLVDATADAFKNWQVATEDQAGALDYLMQVSMASGTEVTDLLTTLTDFGPVFRELGVGFEDAAALIGNLERSGVNTGQVMKGLQRAMVELAKDGITQPLDALRSLEERIKTATSSTEAISIATGVFGKSAVGMVDAIRTGQLTFQTFQGTLQLSGRTVSETADEMKTLEQRLGEVWNELESAFMPAGRVFVDLLEQAVEDARPLIGVLGDMAHWFAELDPKMQQVIFYLGGIVAAAGPTAIGIGLISKAAAEALDGLKLMGEAASGANKILGGFGVAGAGVGLASVALLSFGAAIMATVDDLEKLKVKAEEVRDLVIRDLVFRGKTVEELKALGFSIQEVKAALEGTGLAVDNLKVKISGWKPQQDSPFKILQRDADGLTEAAQSLVKKQADLQESWENAKLAVEDLSKAKAQGKDVTIALALAQKDLQAAYDALHPKIEKVKAATSDLTRAMELILGKGAVTDPFGKAAADIAAGFDKMNASLKQTIDIGGGMVSTMENGVRAIRPASDATRELTDAQAGLRVEMQNGVQTFRDTTDAAHQLAGAYTSAGNAADILAKNAAKTAAAVEASAHAASKASTASGGRGGLPGFGVGGDGPPGAQLPGDLMGYMLALVGAGAIKDGPEFGAFTDVMSALGLKHVGGRSFETFSDVEGNDQIKQMVRELWDLNNQLPSGQREFAQVGSGFLRGDQLQASLGALDAAIASATTKIEAMRTATQQMGESIAGATKSVKEQAAPAIQDLRDQLWRLIDAGQGSSGAAYELRRRLGEMETELVGSGNAFRDVADAAREQQAGMTALNTETKATTATLAAAAQGLEVVRARAMAIAEPALANVKTPNLNPTAGSPARIAVLGSDSDYFSRPGNSITFMITGNTISSQQAADELMATAIEQMRRRVRMNL